MNIWIKLLSLAVVIGIDMLIWSMLRFYGRTGTILAFPRSITRDRSPKWFRFNMAVGWLSLALCVTFTFVVLTILFLV